MPTIVRPCTPSRANGVRCCASTGAVSSESIGLIQSRCLCGFFSYLSKRTSSTFFMPPIIDRRGCSLVPSAPRTPPESNPSGAHDYQIRYANDTVLMTKSKNRIRRTIDETKETLRFVRNESKRNEKKISICAGKSPTLQRLP